MEDLDDVLPNLDDGCHPAHDAGGSWWSPGTEFPDDYDVNDLDFPDDEEDIGLSAMPAFGKAGLDSRGSAWAEARLRQAQDDEFDSKAAEASWAALGSLARAAMPRTRSQATTDVGASGSPNSDVRDGVADHSPASTAPASPASVDPKPWSAEDELCTRSALVAASMQEEDDEEEEEEEDTAPPAIMPHHRDKVAQHNHDDEWADLMPFDVDKALFDEELDLEPSLAQQGACTSSKSSSRPFLKKGSRMAPSGRLLESSGAPSARQTDAAEDPPVSRIVRSYFHPKSQAMSSTAPVMPQASQRYGNAGRQGSLGSLSRCQSESGLPANSSRGGDDDADEVEADEDIQKLRANLQQQLRKFERENESLQRLRTQFEQSEKDLAKERERLRTEVEAEKKAMHVEFDNEKAALKREKRRLSQSAARQRQQMIDDREAQEERKQLKERSEQLEEELREKEKRWQRTVDRLQKQINDLTRKNQELQEEVKCANSQQATQAHLVEGYATLGSSLSNDARRGSSVGSARPRRTPAGPWTQGGPSTTPPDTRPSGSSGSRPSSVRRAAATPQASTPCLHSTPSTSSLHAGRKNSVHELDPQADKRESSIPRPQFHTQGADARAATESTSQAPRVASGRAAGVTGGISISPAAVPRVRVVAPLEGPGGGDSQEVMEVRRTDDRTEKIFTDGRREVEFSNGLRKVMWADGRATVYFQNGDRKEIHPDKVVVYHYSETGAVQTTLPDKTEVYRFADGQFERHYPDGSKEIRFPNGTSKQISADGAEEILFADGTVRRSPAPVHASKE
mmetsp:Transcript_49486/g.115746  ORF Transcript_49486/g.115746 Transcript_49486/m.115746 type:complete len:796 (-) Transcript_49486:82-2469(-)